MLFTAYGYHIEVDVSGNICLSNGDTAVLQVCNKKCTLQENYRKNIKNGVRKFY